MECVKLLISNDLGVDCNGKRVSSVNLISCLGLTGDYAVC